ncbi:free fatty acid receptor 2-like [Arapaima gigas]
MGNAWYGQTNPDAELRSDSITSLKQLETRPTPHGQPSPNRRWGSSASSAQSDVFPLHVCLTIKSKTLPRHHTVGTIKAEGRRRAPSDYEMEKNLDHRLMLAVYFITFITGLPANILACYAFIQKFRQKPTPIDILLLNLTISDLIFLIFLPFKIKEAADGMEWNLAKFLCPLSGFIFYATIYNSTFFLMGISVERFLGVAYPIKYKLHRRPLYAVIASVIFWVFSLSHCSIVYIMEYYNSTNVSEQQRVNSCYKDFTQEQLKILLPVRLELFLVLFCIPFLICTFCYINFIRILCKLPHFSQQKRKQAVGLSVGTLLVYILCFGPYNVSHVVGFVTGASPTWRNYALLFSTFNACLDPIVFYFSSSTLRKLLKNIFKRLLVRLQMTCCYKYLYCLHWSCGGTEEVTQSSNETS